MNILDQFRLKGKTTVVTGGAKGLGASFSKILSEAGANVVIIDVEEQLAHDTVNSLSHDGDHLALKADLTNEFEVETAFEKIRDKYGSLNVLINNAGICQRINTLDMSLEDWKKTFDVNVNSMFIVSKSAAEIMKSNGGGSIVNIASMAGIVSLTYSQSAYNASKGAVIMLTKSLAQEWVDYSIRVNAIAPGFMETDMTKPMFEGEGPLSHVLDQVPMKRLGNPQELGGTVLLLASNASSFVTGAVIPVDGGYTMI